MSVNVCMSNISVSIVIASFGVVYGICSILLIMLFWIIDILPISFLVTILASAPYKIIGIMHVSNNFHIVPILIFFKDFLLSY